MASLIGPLFRAMNGSLGIYIYGRCIKAILEKISFIDLFTFFPRKCLTVLNHIGVDFKQD